MPNKRIKVAVQATLTLNGEFIEDPAIAAEAAREFGGENVEVVDDGVFLVDLPGPLVRKLEKQGYLDLKHGKFGLLAEMP